MREHFIGGLQVGFHALEAMRRQLASELGRHGIRVVTLKTGGIPSRSPSASPAATGSRRARRATLLGRPATLEDVGDAAACAASDKARTMTAATINISCGALLD